MAAGSRFTIRQMAKGLPGARPLVLFIRERQQRLALGALWSLHKKRLVRRAGMSLSKFVAATLQAGDIAFDVGANSGWLAELMASCVGKRGLVCAFEPNPTVFSKLKESSEECWHHNMRPYPFALFDETATISLLMDLREGGYASTASIEHAERETAWHAAQYALVSVAATTLDAFCETSGFMPTFLKIDVEGAEEMVIRGGRQMIASNRPAIWFECWCGLKKDGQINHHLSHFELLSRIDYQFFLATVFKLNGMWIPEQSHINPTHLLPLQACDLEDLPPLGCDVLAVTPDRLHILQKHNLVAKLDAKSHVLASVTA